MLVAQELAAALNSENSIRLSKAAAALRSQDACGAGASVSGSATLPKVPRAVRIDFPADVQVRFN